MQRYLGFRHCFGTEAKSGNPFVARYYFAMDTVEAQKYVPLSL